jgi:hypothetical protein
MALDRKKIDSNFEGSRNIFSPISPVFSMAGHCKLAEARNENNMQKGDGIRALPIRSRGSSLSWLHSPVHPTPDLGLNLGFKWGSQI